MIVAWFWQKSFWTDWRGWVFATVVVVVATLVMQMRGKRR